MSILVDKNTKVIVQGLTGKTGGFHTEQALAYLGEHGDVWMGGDAVHEAQTTHRQKHRRQQGSHHHESAAGPLGGGFSKHLHAIGDCLDTGHGRATGAESPQNQKQAEGLSSDHRWGLIGLEAVGEEQVDRTSDGQHRHHQHE